MVRVVMPNLENALTIRRAARSAATALEKTWPGKTVALDERVFYGGYDTAVLGSAAGGVDAMMLYDSPSLTPNMRDPSRTASLDEIAGELNLTSAIPKALYDSSLGTDGALRRVPAFSSPEILICRRSMLEAVQGPATWQPSAEASAMSSASPNSTTSSPNSPNSPTSASALSARANALASLRRASAFASSAHFVATMNAIRDRAGEDPASKLIRPLVIANGASTFETGLLQASAGTAFVSGLAAGNVSFHEPLVLDWIETLNDMRNVTVRHNLVLMVLGLMRGEHACLFGPLTVPQMIGLDVFSTAFVLSRLPPMPRAIATGTKPPESDVPLTLFTMWLCAPLDPLREDQTLGVEFIREYVRAERAAVAALSPNASLAAGGPTSTLVPVEMYRALPPQFAPMLSTAEAMASAGQVMEAVQLIAHPALSATLVAELHDPVFPVIVDGVSTVDKPMAPLEPRRVIDILEHVRLTRVLSKTPPPAVAVSVQNEAEGAPLGKAVVTLAPDANGDVVRFTIDGSPPSERSPFYDDPVVVTVPEAGFLTVRATARRGGLAPSDESVESVYLEAALNGGDALSAGTVALIVIAVLITAAAMVVVAVTARKWLRMRRAQADMRAAANAERLRNALELEQLNEGLRGEIAERRVLEAKLVRESAAKSQFVANMSHELRTPIHGIRLGAGLLMMSELEDDQMEIAASMDVSAGLLLTIVNDIIDVSMLEEGKFDIKHEPFDPLNVFENCIRLVAPRAGTSGVIVAGLADPKLPQFVVSDGNRLSQALINFLSNAVKFTGRGCVVAVVSYEPHGGGGGGGGGGMGLDVGSGRGALALDDKQAWAETDEEANCPTAAGRTTPAATADAPPPLCAGPPGRADGLVRAAAASRSGCSEKMVHLDIAENPRTGKFDGDLLMPRPHQHAAAAAPAAAALRRQRFDGHTRNPADQNVAVRVPAVRQASRIRSEECGAPVSDGFLTFEVRDTGVGIAHASLDALFERFSQVDDSHSRSHGGAGLGLYITREIVESLGGSVGVQTKVGVGSTFWLRVPVAVASSLHPEDARGVNLDLEHALVPTASARKHFNDDDGNREFPDGGADAAERSGDGSVSESDAESRGARHGTRNTARRAFEARLGPKRAQSFARLSITDLPNAASAGKPGRILSQADVGQILASTGSSSTAHRTAGSVTPAPLAPAVHASVMVIVALGSDPRGAVLATYFASTLGEHARVVWRKFRGIGDGSSSSSSSSGPGAPKQQQQQQRQESREVEVLGPRWPIAGTDVIAPPAMPNLTTIKVDGPVVGGSAVVDVGVVVADIKGAIHTADAPVAIVVTTPDVAARLSTVRFLAGPNASKPAPTIVVVKPPIQVLQQLQPAGSNTGTPDSLAQAAAVCISDPITRDRCSQAALAALEAWSSAHSNNNNIGTDRGRGSNDGSDDGSDINLPSDGPSPKRRALEQKSGSQVAGIGSGVGNSNSGGVASGRLVIFAEDNPVSAKLMLKLMSKLGARVVHAENGQIAVDLYRAHVVESPSKTPLPLVILDCQMPVMTGWEAARAIRKLEHEHNLPRVTIIALTAAVLANDVAACMDAGFDHHYVKPVPLPKFRELLELA